MEIAIMHVCLCVCTWTAAAQPSKFRFSDDQKTLTVSSVCKNDCGGPNDVMVIQCNASNTHGYVLGSGYINVFGQFCSDARSTSFSVVGPSLWNSLLDNLRDPLVGFRRSLEAFSLANACSALEFL